MKKLLKALLFPHIIIICILTPIATALLIYAFAATDENSIISYISYFLSAYTLTVICLRAPEIWEKYKSFKDKNKYISRYLKDTHLRVRISLFSSLIMNTAYAVFQLFLGFYHRSIWFYSLAVYYILLAVMRFFLLRDVRTSSPKENMLSELRRYRFCGIILLIMNLSLGVIVFYIAWQNRGFTHHFITTIAMAAYTFFTFTVAIINVIKYRKEGSPLFSASKAISLASATVSILTLETAMLSVFGTENSEAFRQIMTSSTGAAVCIFVLLLAIYMIIKSSKEIKKGEIKNGK